MVNFDKVPYIYWSNKMRMSFLQRRIIVYSVMYYMYNESCVSDKYYDSISKQLIALRKEDKESYKKSDYYYCMYDFDGNTGFDIPYRLTKEDKEKLNKIAKLVYVLWKKEGKK